MASLLLIGPEAVAQGAPERGQLKRGRVSEGPKVCRVDDDVSRMDDFEVIRERQDVMKALARLTDRYRRLNAEMTSRKTLRWMVAR